MPARMKLELRITYIMTEQNANRIVDDLRSIIVEGIFPVASDSTDNGLQTLEE